MDQVIAQLYRGLWTAIPGPIRSVEEKQAQAQAIELEHRLKEQLGEEAWKVYLEIEPLKAKANDSLDVQVFVHGFRLGARLMAGILME